MSKDYVEYFGEDYGREKEFEDKLGYLVMPPYSKWVVKEVKEAIQNTLEYGKRRGMDEKLQEKLLYMKSIISENISAEDDIYLYDLHKIVLTWYRVVNKGRPAGV